MGFERLKDLEGLHFLNGCLLNLFVSASIVWGLRRKKEEEPDERRESG
jgi:hypothetical protein